MTISLFIAFIAGLVSFLSPCVLPIVPGFLAYLAGSSLEQNSRRVHVLVQSIVFVLGFSSVFALLGVALNTILSHIAYDVQTWLARVGGSIIIIFGLYLTGLLPLPFLEKERKLNVSGFSTSRLLTSFLFGAAFAAGWTPCVGAVLGSILALSATAPGSALRLLFSYSIGLGVPFIIVGAFAAGAQKLIARLGPWLHAITAIFGVLLIIIGILAFTQTLSLVANFSILNKFLLK